MYNIGESDSEHSWSDSDKISSLQPGEAHSHSYTNVAKSPNPMGLSPKVSTSKVKSSLQPKNILNTRKPIVLRFKNGLTEEQILQQNKVNDDQKAIENTFYALLRNSDVRGARRLIKRNSFLNSLDTRTLNEDYPINQHRFCKRDGRITLIKDVNRQHNDLSRVERPGCISNQPIVTQGAQQFSKPEVVTTIHEQPASDECPTDQMLGFQPVVQALHDETIHEIIKNVISDMQALHTMILELQTQAQDSKQTIHQQTQQLDEHRNVIQDIVNYINGQSS